MTLSANIQNTYTGIGFSGGSVVKNPPANAGDTGDTALGWEYSLEEEMATNFSILAWRIPWTEEPGWYSPWRSKELDMTEVT